MADIDPTVQQAQTRLDDDGGVAGLYGEADRDLIRVGSRSVRYVRLVVDASAAPRGAARSPVHLALAVDRSGSMAGDRIALAKQAVVAALQMLSHTDTFSLVWFDHYVTPAVVPARAATREAVANAVQDVERVDVGGSTALHAGWRAAARTAEPGATGFIKRCLLITDGQANQGLQAPADLAAQTRSMLGERGVVTSCLGLGDGYNDELLRAMADACDGQAHHVRDAASLPAVLAREVGDALSIVGRSVELQIRPSDGVRIDVLGHFRNHWTGRHLAVSLGDLVGGQQLELVLRLTMPAGSMVAAGPAPAPSIEVTAWSGGEPCVVPPVQLQWAYADHVQNDRQPRRIAVDRVVATAYASLAREQAGDLAVRDPKAASGVLRKTGTRISTYTGADEVLKDLVGALEHDATAMEQGVDEGTRKALTMTAYSSSKGRSSDGSVRRRSEPWPVR